MSSKMARGALQRLCENFNTAHSLAVAILLRYEDDLGLISLPFDPSVYLETDLQKFRDDYLVSEYLSKYQGLRTGIRTRQVALDSFTAAEDRCKQTNARVRALWTGSGSFPWVAVFCRAQQKIQDCIGSEPSFVHMLGEFKWGKGATYSLKGEVVALDSKLCEEQISVTHEALPLLRAAMSVDLAWLQARGLDAEGPASLLNDSFNVVNGSRGLTVPKNAKTDRFIAAEPTGNIFLQLGVGQHIRKCLKRVGINLDDQSINQRYAEDALSLGLATVDLKAASDTIASAIVWQLLPHRWATFLDLLRSPAMRVGKSWIRLEKFSSMGNGFTFELETLIFWALVESLRDLESKTGGRVSVYGDDIICPSDIIPQLIELLDFCGFEVNTKKSHWSGLFRESCGKHYFGGKDVTPIYQKEVPKGRVERYRCHNRLLYHAIDRGSLAYGVHAIADRTLLTAVRFARVCVEEQDDRVIRIPLQPAHCRDIDAGLATPINHNWDPAWQFGRSRRQIRAKALTWKSFSFPAAHAAVYANTLRVLSRRRDTISNDVCSVRFDAQPFAGMLTRRGRGKYRVKTRYFPEVCSLQWA